MARKLVLSLAARQDLRDLYRDGFERWGEAQADRYFDALLAQFEAICDAPLRYQAVDEVRESYRRSICGKHAIYYRLVGEEVHVMAVIKRQDITIRS